MRDIEKNNSCIYNPLYVKFNEDMGRREYFSYNLQYPSFHNLKFDFFNIDSGILSNLNSTIKENVYTFKDGLSEEEKEVNNLAVQNSLLKKHYKAISDYSVTFNKNYILSTILNLMGFVDNNELLYNQINNYNFDLLTGNEIYLKDMFNPGIDYIKLVRDYVIYKISQNKNFYYDDVSIEISEDQAFYLTDDGIIVYFDLDEIAPKEFGISKFKLSFDKFSPYINQRFYCSPDNVVEPRKRHHSSRR